MKLLALVVTLFVVFWGGVASASCSQVGVDEYTVEKLDFPLGRLRCASGPDVHKDDLIRIYRANGGESSVPGADEAVTSQAAELNLKDVRKIFVVSESAERKIKCFLAEAWPEWAIFLSHSGEEIALTKLCSGG